MMFCFRLASLVEYIKDAMIKGLEDCSPYVRRAAVIGSLQLYQLDPKEIEGVCLSVQYCLLV